MSAPAGPPLLPKPASPAYDSRSISTGQGAAAGGTRDGYVSRDNSEPSESAGLLEVLRA